jgi:PAS domain S-box-containing protein
MELSTIADAVPHGHTVQFYETEDVLQGRVGGFLAEALSAGDAAIIFATPAHHDLFSDAVRQRGCDASQLLFFDAEEALGRFMDGLEIDEERFRGMVCPVLEKAGNGARVYGEMVDLLWRDGNTDAAIRLEQLWNELGRIHQFQLLCAYPMDNFYKEAHSPAFDQICRDHSLVYPAGSVIGPLTDDQARQIAVLQQRARALENEIEHRRAAEKALRDSQRELKDFVENATIGMHWVGPDGTILWANDAELALLGYTREEYVGRNIADFHADRSTIEDILGRLCSGNEIHDYEARLRAKDGSIRHVAISSSVLFDQGKFVHTRCFTRDITDRKRLEDERQLLLDAATILNGSLDVESRLSEIAQLVSGRFAPSCIIDLVRDDGSAERVAVASSGDAELPSDGNPEKSLLTAIRFDDRVLGTIGFGGRSFTAADRPLAKDLASRIACALENARLYRLAQEGNRAKDEFLATLSHELRTPLTAILGWARMLRGDVIDPQMVRSALETIERSARAQAALIDDILDLSRVITGKLALQMELLDLGPIVESAVDTVRVAATARGIQIQYRRAAEPMFVMGDATRLQQIVWNLLSNAVKFSPEESVVSIELRRTDSAARVVVRDRGIGIRREFLPHVFEPFRQGDANTTRSHGGLGLGLAIVKHFVESHGGTVAVESAGEGRGSTFTIALPLAARAKERLRRPVAESTGSNLTGTSVLVVDDDRDTRTFVSAALKTYGADVMAADSVDEACAMFEQRRPHVVVTDIAMPVRDGFDLLRHLRDNGEVTPAIALTALGRADDEQRIIAAGFDAYARKPFDPAEFADIVASVRDRGDA